ncbi:MAG: PIG-L family deacetylase [Polyangia bacterium]
MNVFVQPHLDDVAWSCGGTVRRLARQAPCRVVTVFDRSPEPSRSLSPFARMLHTAWGAGRDPLPMRRAENERALRILGATGEGLSIHEALYRDPPVSSSGELLTPPGPALAPLVREIAERLVVACRGATRVFLPLGIATHVDHMLCYAAHERLRATGLVVHHYEDFPYVTRLGKLVARLNMVPVLASFTVDIDDTLPARIEAIRAYPSQLGPMGMDRPDELVRTHAASVVERGHGERFWTLDPHDSALR